jgi:hypothetical protein
VALNRRQLDELHVPAGSLKPARKLPLLRNREQGVCLYTDDQHALGSYPGKTGCYRPAELSDIKQIARTGQVQVAVGIELASELHGLCLEIGLDLEIHGKRVAGLPFLTGPFTAEPLLPFAGRPVGHHAKLPGKPHAGDRASSGGVVAICPGRIATDHLALERAHGNGVWQCTRRRRQQHEIPRHSRILDRECQRRHTTHRGSHDSV